MKWYFKDPTAEKWDQIPLTPEELKKVRRSVIIWGAIAIVITQFILYML